MNQILSTFHGEAAERIVSAYNESGIKTATVCIPTGLGAGLLFIEVINIIIKTNPDAKVFYLAKTREETEQFEKRVKSINFGLSVCSSVREYGSQSVLALTYNAYFANFTKLNGLKSDLIICRDAESLNGPRFMSMINRKSRLILGVFASIQTAEKSPFRNAPCLLKISPDLSYNELLFQEKLAVPMLRRLGFKDIQGRSVFNTNNMTIIPNIIAQKDGLIYFIEVKTYRSMFNDRQVVWHAINQINTYKSILENPYRNSRFGIILMCDIDESTKEEAAKEYGIFIWDIKNLLYLCRECIELSDILEQIAPYALNGIKPVPPVKVDSSVKFKAPVVTEKSYEAELIEKIKNCKTGRTKKADIEYEKICAEILSYLFKNEFSQFSEQHTTSDDMFRMDIICGLKGTTAFWKFLIKFYNTKFVVFECKNYSHKIEQNLIYVTDKYLFNPVLRNVAFILSRKGFNNNAQKAALGILKEQGKLILDITDTDLETMINAKAEGKEPSDFLLDKVEKLLMGISV